MAGRAATSRPGLVVEVLRTYRRVRALLRDDQLEAALAGARSALASGEPGPSLEYLRALRLGRAVQRTLTAVPGLDSRCLMQSVVLLAMLARRGTPAVLVLGIRPGADFGAHAWVELRGRPLLPTFGDDFSRLVEL